jgi:D-alanyl-D-alanine carboxypeptidase (penicillin-binding protein 5/6)
MVMALAGPVAPALGSRLATDRIGGKAASETSGLNVATGPDITAPAGMLVTADGRELWARKPDQRRAMASITKIMTALVVLQHGDLDRTVSITASDTAVGESAAGIEEGDRLTVNSLLQAMMVRSANEAAMALARATGGSVKGFVDLMNAKAVALGLKGTHFDNPHGLDGKSHYTTASDLATLARAAMTDPRFRALVTQRAVTLTGKAGRRTVHSTDTMLAGYPGAEGIKTGFTNDAGYSFVGAAKRGPIELMSVILGTKTERARFTQTRKLLDWGFEHYRERQLAKAGTPAGTVAVGDYLDRAVPVQIAETTSAAVFDVDGPVTGTFHLAAEVAAPVARGQRVGVYTVSQPGRVLVSVPVVASADVPAPGALEALGIWWKRTWSGWTHDRVRARTAAPAPVTVQQ